MIKRVVKYVIGVLSDIRSKMKLRREYRRYKKNDPFTYKRF